MASNRVLRRGARIFPPRRFVPQRGTQEKTRIDLPTLEMAALFADQDLKDKWEFYKERYLSKLK